MNCPDDSEFERMGEKVGGKGRGRERTERDPTIIVRTAR